MGFTRTSETGTYEAFSKTIGAAIEREWDTANTNISSGGEPIVKFIYSDTEINPRNLTEMMEAIVLRDGGSFPLPERTANGHDLIGMGETVIIDVYGASQKKRKFYELEIYRILRKLRPIGNNPPMKKSNNADTSPIHDYDEILPEFIAFDDGVQGQEKSSKSSAVLTLISEWVYT